jgi:uncharacterized protein (UPF0147 family)
MKTTSKEQMQVGNQTEQTEQLPVMSPEMEEVEKLLEDHNIPVTKENIKVVENFLSESHGTIEGKLETLKVVLDKGITLTAKNLMAVHSALSKDLTISSDVIASLPVDDIEFKDKVIKEDHTQKPVKPKLPTKVVKKMIADVLFNEKPADTSAHKLRETLNEVDVEKLDTLSDDDFDMIEKAFEDLVEHIDEIAAVITPIVNDIETPPPVRKVIEREVTVKMIEAKNTFEMYQKSIESQLEKALSTTQKSVSLKEVISSVIDKLDHVINKTDVPLYTDIKTERDLLASSGLLEKARNLLDHDDEKAIDIVKSVQKRVAAITFKPSRQKMFGITKGVLYDKLYEKELINTIPIKLNHDVASSPRQVLELLRTFGLNHESEASELLGKHNKEEMKLPSNIKSILMKLQNTDQKVMAKETMSQLTGQQLLNKLEVKSHKQSLTLKLPVEIAGVSKQLKVHVNAQKTQEKMDWKNSRLYFVVHLNKIGDTGVLVDIKAGALKITLKNDTPNLKKSIGHFLDEAMHRLEEVGFTHASISVESLTYKETKAVESIKEGFDVVL